MALTVTHSEAHAQALRDAQARADAAYVQHGRQAPMPVHGEQVTDYTRRLMGGLQKHSKDLASMNLAGIPPTILPVFERQIYADAVAAARSPTDVAPGTLREIVTTDGAGRKVREFFGHPDACFAPFKIPAQRCKINDPRQR